MTPRRPPHTQAVLVTCLALSLLGHSIAGLVLERCAPHDLGRAISRPAAVLVDLKQPDQPLPPITISRPVVQRQAAQPTVLSPTPPVASSQLSIAKPTPTPVSTPQPITTTTAPASSQTVYLQADHIFPQQQEKLVYQISLSGIPVGSAQLEASNNQGELRIQSTIRSNSFISAFYQVDDSTDTRLIKGRYLLTRIRQHEGPYVSDTGFNLMYAERKIFWVDRIRKRFSNEVLETLDTLDFVSGFYCMRLQPLKVGDNMTLHLYDGDTTTVVPVTVLRQEKLNLPGMRSAATVVVQPQFAESGFFKNNRDLLVWFTDDQNHVPVRIEATTPIGRVAAELVSSERVVQATGSPIVPDTKMQYK